MSVFRSTGYQSTPKARSTDKCFLCLNDTFYTIYFPRWWPNWISLLFKRHRIYDRVNIFFLSFQDVFTVHLQYICTEATYFHITLVYSVYWTRNGFIEPGMAFKQFHLHFYYATNSQMIPSRSAIPLGFTYRCLFRLPFQLLWPHALVPSYHSLTLFLIAADSCFHYKSSRSILSRTKWQTHTVSS